MLKAQIDIKKYFKTFKNKKIGGVVAQLGGGGPRGCKNITASSKA